jgi:hypothetical protein
VNGATVARRIPVPKVAGSNPVSLRMIFFFEVVISISQSVSIGLRRIKSLPCFYLRTGGGLTTNESHKMCDFGGWLVYCPALDNENFRGRGIMATRSVQWHPLLYPERNLDTRKSMRVDGPDSALCPSGTNKRLPVSSLVKSIELSRSEIGAFDARLNAEIQEDVATFGSTTIEIE